MHHLRLLKARLAKLCRELITPKGGDGGGPGEGFDVAKTGDAPIGFVGKSTVQSYLAGVYYEVAACEFTTLMSSDAKCQDPAPRSPGFTEGAKDGKGRGHQVTAVTCTCHLILIVLDVLKPLRHKSKTAHELEDFGTHLNSTSPNTGFKKKDKEVINLTATCPQSEQDAETVKRILADYKIHNADITSLSDANADKLFDVWRETECISFVSRY